MPNTKYLEERNAIEKVKADIMLNTAEGRALSSLGSNFGLARPVFGFNDTIYRAFIRNFAIRIKAR